MSRAKTLLEKHKVQDGALERIQSREQKRAFYNLAKLQWRKNNHALKPVQEPSRGSSFSGGI